MAYNIDFSKIDVDTSVANYGVYVILCENETYYTGASSNVIERIKAHFAGVGSRHTKIHKPIKVIFFLGGLPDMVCACRAERFIKAGGRGLKELLATGNDDFRRVIWRYATYQPTRLSKKYKDED